MTFAQAGFYFATVREEQQQLRELQAHHNAYEIALVLSQLLG